MNKNLKKSIQCYETILDFKDNKEALKKKLNIAGRKPKNFGFSVSACLFIASMLVLMIPIQNKANSYKMLAMAMTDNRPIIFFLYILSAFLLIMAIISTLLYFKTRHHKFKFAVKSCIPIIVFLVGIPLAFSSIRTMYPWVLSGVIIGFALLGLFLHCHINKARRISKMAAVIMLWVGAISGYLIGFRPGMTAGPAPWKWLPSGDIYPAVMMEPYMDWIALSVIYVIYAKMSISLFRLGRKKSNE